MILFIPSRKVFWVGEGWGQIYIKRNSQVAWSTTAKLKAESGRKFLCSFSEREIELMSEWFWIFKSTPKRKEKRKVVFSFRKKKKK